MVDFKPMIDFVLQIADGTVLAIVPTVVGYFAFKWFHINAQSTLGQKIISVASNAAALGFSKSQQLIDAGVHPIEVKNAAIDAGVAYFNQAVSQKTLDAAKITVPTLVIRGALDTFGTREDSQLLTAELGSAVKQYVDIPNASHFMQYEKANVQFFKAIKDFLEAKVEKKQ